MSKIAVLLADDHTIVRQGLRALLEASGDMTVVGEAENGRQALQMTKQLRPDVIVMDTAMAALNALEATRQISRECPGARVLILSAYGGDDYVRRLIAAGASGYLVKQSSAQDLMAAIRETWKGKAFFSPGIYQRLQHRRRAGFGANGRARKPTHHLSRRQNEVLQFIAEGLENRKIAGELSVSIKTVEKHRQALMNKLDLHNIADLTRYAVINGIVRATGQRKGKTGKHA